MKRRNTQNPIKIRTMSRLKHASNSKHLRYDEAVDYDSESDCSDEFDSDSEPSIRPSFKGISRPPRFRAPIGAPRYSRFHEPMDFMSSTTNSSALSSLDTTEGTTETDPSDLYTPIERKRAPMMMVEEISPVLSENSEPLPPRLRLHREWNPQHTSTASNMKPLFKLPKTNPHLTSSTPVRSTRAPVLTTYNQVIAMPQTSRPASYYDIENDPNLVWDNRRPASSSRLIEGYSNGYYKPDHFKIPAVLARNKGISGILFLTMTIGGSILSVNVRNAFYFSEPRQSRYSSYIKLEMKNRLRKRQTSHSSRSSRHHYNEPNSHPTSVRTSIVHNTNKPDFRATFTFQLDLGRERNHQELFIRVYAVESGTSKKMLGCMTFPISRMLEKASRDQQAAYYTDESTVEEVVVNDEGFFLMDAKHGEKNNLPQHKVRLTEFYDDPALSGSCGMTTSSYSSSNLTNSRQMPMEEFVAASRQFGSSMIPGYGANVDVPLDNSSASSSSSYPHYNGRHRLTLPNIVTTSDSSEAYSGVSCQQIQETEHHLYAADNNMNERKFRRGGSPSPTPNAKHVRRATSFTFSPKDSVAKYNQRAPQVKTEKTEENKKKTGPLAKMFSLLRNNKKDSSLSSSSLYLFEKHRLSNEEVAEWEHNFEKLLLHEVGNQLFRKFLEKEHSEENLDFWTACEEFKKMKDGESKTIKMAHEIFETYIREKADKQVNLDSDTRSATKAALESGAHANCFQLAQTQIELLMKTDTYKRFLQDTLFLDFKVRLSEHQRPTSTPNEP